MGRVDRNSHVRRCLTWGTQVPWDSDDAEEEEDEDDEEDEGEAAAAVVADAGAHAVAAAAKEEDKDDQEDDEHWGGTPFRDLCCVVQGPEGLDAGFCWREKSK